MLVCRASLAETSARVALPEQDDGALCAKLALSQGQGACAASTSAAAAITADATAASRLTPLLGVRDTPSLAVGR